jgi:hypothetical protein
MAKALSIFGMAVSILLLLVFGLDLAIGFPFNGYHSVMSISFVVFSALLIYLSWSAFRDAR